MFLQSMSGAFRVMSRSPSGSSSEAYLQPRVASSSGSAVYMRIESTDSNCGSWSADLPIELLYMDIWWIELSAVSLRREIPTPHRHPIAPWGSYDYGENGGDLSVPLSHNNTLRRFLLHLTFIPAYSPFDVKLHCWRP